MGEQNKRVTVDIMKTVKIPIPFNASKIDYDKQVAISNKYDKIDEIKNKVIHQIEKLIEVEPVIYRE